MEPSSPVSRTSGYPGPSRTVPALASQQIPAIPSKSGTPGPPQRPENSLEIDRQFAGLLKRRFLSYLCILSIVLEKTFHSKIQNCFPFEQKSEETKSPDSYITFMPEIYINFLPHRQLKMKICPKVAFLHLYLIFPGLQSWFASSLNLCASCICSLVIFPTIWCGINDFLLWKKMEKLSIDAFKNFCKKAWHSTIMSLHYFHH